MSKLNDFLIVLNELNINENQFDEILTKNPQLLQGDYDEFIININLLAKYKVPYDVIGNLICQNVNFLFYDPKDLNDKLDNISRSFDVTQQIIDNPDIF